MNIIPISILIAEGEDLRSHTFTLHTSTCIDRELYSKWVTKVTLYLEQDKKYKSTLIKFLNYTYLNTIETFECALGLLKGVSDFNDNK